ncbi:MAG: hypothetical protein IPO83_09000 [Chitinophagaceae bacterium]|nr:hypothetical protein [Chitinophagaceae bacterium]
MKKFIILATLIIWILLGIFGWYYVNRPTGTLESTTPDYSLTSPAFFAQFNNNEEAANQQYLGKVIEVSGTVQDITVEENGRLSITLNGDEMFGVSCKMNADSEKLVQKINKGDGIVVKGRCSGKLMDIVLVNCSLQKS